MKDIMDWIIICGWIGISIIQTFILDWNSWIVWLATFVIIISRLQIIFLLEDLKDAIGDKNE